MVVYAYYNTDILHRLAWSQENPCLLPRMPTKKKQGLQERMRTTSFDPLSAVEVFRQLGRIGSGAWRAGGPAGPSNDVMMADIEAVSPSVGLRPKYLN